MRDRIQQRRGNSRRGARRAAWHSDPTPGADRNPSRMGFSRRGTLADASNRVPRSRSTARTRQTEQIGPHLRRNRRRRDRRHPHRAQHLQAEVVDIGDSSSRRRARRDISDTRRRWDKASETHRQPRSQLSPTRPVRSGFRHSSNAPDPSTSRAWQLASQHRSEDARRATQTRSRTPRCRR